jgi:hypothetical protein
MAHLADSSYPDAANSRTEHTDLGGRVGVEDQFKTPSEPTARADTSSRATTTRNTTKPTDTAETNELNDRQYLEVKPGETPLDPRAATQAMELLYTSLQKTTRTRFRDKLTGNAERPVVEWLIASDGRPDTRIRYLVSSDDDSLLADLSNICRTCFPDSYEVGTTTWHPRRIAEHLSAADPESNASQTNHPAITSGHPYVAGVEYEAQGRSRYDWQSPFTAFEEFATDHRRHRQNEPTPNRLPLATLVETMRTAPVPVLYHVVCRPDRKSVE